ncbi:glycosyltransferase [Frigidibacter sp. MR17.14]|uniref:glycosyltransferase n=1 Tax=Frigidibacter sp. MR17.14 TaxID=3126509 RepID=UPI003012EE6D
MGLRRQFRKLKSYLSKRNAGPDRKPRRRTLEAFAAGNFSCDVIVPVHNALEDVQRCLASLAAHPGRFPPRVIVVNDGSDAETSEWLRSFVAQAPRSGGTSFELIDHARNVGYTKAVNAGLRRGTGDFVVTLNSDTIVTEGWVEGLIRCMIADRTRGIVGPLSNAASWQNVPRLYAADGSYAINALPEGMTADQMAELVRRSSARCYPEAHFVNGFCFMISRAVIRKIGILDERTFPQGYGEENDLCIRAAKAGFTLAYADDVYVFHAKSKSFGSERRKTLSKAGNLALRAKHGEKHFLDLVARSKETAPMDAVRRRVEAALVRAGAVAGVTAADWARSADGLMGQRILFLLPVKGGGGGAHSVIQEVTAMRRMGVEARVAVRQNAIERLRQQYSDIPENAELFVGIDDDTVVEIGGGFDIVVATIFSSARLLRDIVAAHPHVRPAYYVQDYEPMFFEQGTDRWQEAHESYALVPNTLLFAKTDWLCRTVSESHGVPVHRVKASIDHACYRPGVKQKRDGGQFNISAMIRPNTPRRGAAETMAALARLKSRFGEALEIRIFGCTDQAMAEHGLAREFELRNLGILTRTEVAKVLGWSDLFIDMSTYQAFGRTGLEAMACGAVAAVPREGGADEYAVDGVNAIVLDTSDLEACVSKITAHLEDPAGLRAMQVEALKTAIGYSTHAAALSELMLFGQWGAQVPEARIIPGPDAEGVSAARSA